MRDSINLKDSINSKESPRHPNSTLRNSKKKNFDKLIIEKPSKQINYNSPASVNEQTMSKIGSHLKTKSEVLKPKELGTITIEKLNITSSRKHLKKNGMLGATVYTKTNIKSAKSSALENNMFSGQTGNQDSSEAITENINSHLNIKRHSMEQDPESTNTAKLSYYNNDGTMSFDKRVPREKEKLTLPLMH